MTESILAQLKELLVNFKIRSGIEAVVIMTRSGVNLVSSVTSKTNPDTLVAISSALQNAADIMVRKTRNSSADRVVIECKHSNIIIADAGQKALLLVMTDEHIALGPLFMEMNILTGQVKKLLECY
ncbi:MAG: roadblock/LC7 domain-containing protein [ANME-2 cluster archaeon]|nr:roadblock/LC7 domain-containing protein [ANME-2 cluster archaeon]